MILEHLTHLSQKIDHKTIDRCRAFASSTEGVIGISTALLLTSLLIYRRSARKADRGCPVVPRSHFFFGSSEEYRSDPKAFTEKWTKQLGPVFRAHLFGKMVTVVSGPDVREVFNKSDEFDFLLAMDRVFDLRLLTNSNQQGLTTGDVHKIISRCLTRKLDDYTERVVQQLKAGADDELHEMKDAIELNHMYPLVQHMVARASASVFVGTELCQNQLLIDSFKNMVLEVGAELRPNPWLEPFPRLNRLRMWFIGKTSTKVKRHRQQLYDALKPEVEKRLREKESNPDWGRPNDILQDVLDEFPCPPQIDQCDYLVNWITQLIFAALHTTSENSTVVLYRLLQNPEIIDELLKEQQEVLAQEGYAEDVGPEVFTRKILKKFVKLDSVCRESFRCRNEFINLPHEYIGKTQKRLNSGSIIYPGEHVLINLWYNHRGSGTDEYTGGDPTKFLPFRFVDQDKPVTKIGADFLFFGLGPHACPGRWFAMQEVQTIVSLLIREFKMSAIEQVVFPMGANAPLPYGKIKIEKRQ